MLMVTDNPISSTREDKFGFEAYAKIICSAIMDTDKLPFCIGLFGEWGSGKSSLMSMIKEIVDTHNAIKSIWFNPWKYDKKEDLWNALIQSILFKIIDEKSNAEVSKRAKELANSAMWLMIKKSLSALSTGILSEENIDKVTKALSKHDELYYRHINHFEHDFKEVVELYTNRGKLVVFIDDLDRCLPENAITVLESLKLFIGNANCVFVLGMDHLIIEKGINFRFGERIEICGRDYLDKIIQVPFFLPPVPFNKLRKSLQITTTTHYSEQVWQLIELGLEGNPRKTKRFVNCFYLAREIRHHPELFDMPDKPQDDESSNLTLEVQDFYLAKLLIFQITFIDFYSHLKYNPDAWKFYEEKVIRVDTLEDRQRNIEDRPSIKKFWENEHFRSFMMKTSMSKSTTFPEAPPGKVVINLLKAISLITPKSQKDKSNPDAEHTRAGIGGGANFYKMD